MFGAKPGTWWLMSKSDPRWNTQGYGDILVSAGMHRDASAFIERKKTELGEPPDDLEYGCMKD